MSTDINDHAAATTGNAATAVPIKRSLLGRLIVAMFITSVFTVVMTGAVWPGELKLTAPFVCTDEQPDPIVVTDSYSYRPGETSYQFTMYCVGERGDATDVGFFKPFAMVFGAHLVIVILLMLWAARPRRDRATSPRASGPGSTSGPFAS